MNGGLLLIATVTFFRKLILAKVTLGDVEGIKIRVK